MSAPQHSGPDRADQADAGWQMVEFPSAGVTLRGRLYGAAPSPKACPAVIMAHGFSATISGMVADLYAEAFAEAGLAVLLYDHHSLGISDGEPRCQIDDWHQARGYVDAVTFLASVEGIDPERIAVWGDSMSGRLALAVAAADQRVKAVVVQVPACGDDLIDGGEDDGAFAELREIILHADLGAFEREVSDPRPVVSPDQLHMPSHLLPLTAFRWFIEFGGRFGTNWENRATVAKLATPVTLDAAVWGPHVTVPTLMVTAHHDEMHGSNADVARQVLALTKGPSESVELGGGHFGLLYPGTSEFTKSVAAQREFLVRHLQGQAAGM